MTLMSFNKTHKRILNNQNLYQIITYKEVKKIVSKVKKRKAAGLDRILNEMLKFLTPTLIDSLVKLLNLIKSTNIIPMKCCQGLISPIFKPEFKLNPENYRPICVTSCLSKLFCLTLNERLTTLLHKYNIIDLCQIGFQAKSRTSDHIFSLKTLINMCIIHQKVKFMLVLLILKKPMIVFSRRVSSENLNV